MKTKKTFDRYDPLACRIPQNRNVGKMKTKTQWLITTTTKRHGYKWQVMFDSESRAREEYEKKKRNRSYETVEITERKTEVRP